MQQILQSLATGEITLAESAAPNVSSKSVLIKTHYSLISSGTERMLVEFGRGNLLNKIKQQPEKVNQVLNKIKTDGMMATIDSVKSKLDQPIPLGYCNVGEVIEVGKEVYDLTIGDMVLSNGHHAEIVSVPRNLCARIPRNVDPKEAVFGIMGSIALQGIRLANPLIGETFVVSGLGLVGLLAIQILKANGCKVIGIDFDERKLSLAKQYGALALNANNDLEEIINIETNFNGVDGVIVAAATPSSDPINFASKITRKRGRVIQVGLTGMNLVREEFYAKEITFQVSCSYGPGRYDQSYEENSNDYPFGYIRWTENRNFIAILELMADKKISTKELVSYVFDFENAKQAYESIINDKNILGILFKYNFEETKPIKIFKNDEYIPRQSSPVSIGLIGSGSYASKILFPALSKLNANLISVSSQSGISASLAAKKFNVKESTTDLNSIFTNNEINTILVSTRHDSHASLLLKALEFKKHIFMEKPLCIKQSELLEILKKIDSIESKDLPNILVGFNRRFSPLAVKARELLLPYSSVPKSIIYNINAGSIDPDHWVHDVNIGGGRVIGECCHFIDLARFFVNSPISSFDAKYMKANCNDTVSISLSFQDGSIASINYFSNGSKSLAKENILISTMNKTIAINNFMSMKLYGFKGKNSVRLFSQNKGADLCLKEFINSIRYGNKSPISLSEIIEVSSLTIQLADLSKN